MRLSAVLAIVLANVGLRTVAQKQTCASVPSCSENPDHKDVDPCCVPSSGGLFIFKQRLQLDVADEMGNWGIDGLEVLDCGTLKPLTTQAISPAQNHEQIASLCLKSKLFGGEEGFIKAEREWAQSEVGEGVEEVWERAWSSAGRYISTLSPQCLAPGEEHGVPLFFDTLHRLQDQFPTAKMLADADITPSSDTTYSLSEIQSALSLGVYNVLVTCDNTIISSISWPLIVTGTFQSGQFSAFSGASDALGSSNCPSEGISYPSSFHPPSPKPSDRWDPIFRPQPRAITKSHDEARMYYPSSAEETGIDDKREDPLKLGFFKGKDQGREEREDGFFKQFARDEL